MRRKGVVFSKMFVLRSVGNELVPSPITTPYPAKNLNTHSKTATDFRMPNYGNLLLKMNFFNTFVFFFFFFFFFFAGGGGGGG